MSEWSLRQKLRESVIDAVNRGDQTEVEMLLNKGADVNEGTGGYLAKQTLLLIAMQKGHVDIANLLVDRGADLTATVMVNKRELTALDIAKEKELLPLVSVIQKKTEANQRLLLAVQEGNSDKVQTALNTGANINLLTKDGDSVQMNLLLIALSQGHINVVQLLIQRGIDLHYTVTFPDQTEPESARSFAKRLNHNNVVELIDNVMEKKETNQDERKMNANSHDNFTVEPVAKSTGGIVDIEDDEDEQVQMENSSDLRDTRRQPRSSNCVIS
ncbi:ankyrin repeat and KH domain-containing protein 1-like [Asterias rubens]|uniref:ankyrin repeat and KH domain-containing protein 1-like n=1 Tax=Asterias rubens TaxID=7604 RepID=UPI0014550C34|nr:ankyrin repeat and KH domain-containing protein 1-like [Asterias rubens]XP_033629494.1 ankyrin repeat and KH domain-containing protein 1-like [Asterias rubens]